MPRYSITWNESVQYQVSITAESEDQAWENWCNDRMHNAEPTGWVELVHGSEQIKRMRTKDEIIARYKRQVERLKDNWDN